jgi:hypothetical protein
MKLNNLQDVIEKSINWIGENQELDCNITLNEEGQTFQAYTVSIAHRDLLFYTDKGVLNYLIDKFGDKYSLSLFSIEK